MADPAEDVPAEDPMRQGDGGLDLGADRLVMSGAGRVGAMIELADQMDGSIEVEDAMVAMIADVHGASADRAGAVQDIEFPEGEVGVVRPAVGHGDHLAEARLGAGSDRKLCPRWVLAPWRAVVLFAPVDDV